VAFNANGFRRRSVSQKFPYRHWAMEMSRAATVPRIVKSPRAGEWKTTETTNKRQTTMTPKLRGEKIKS